MQFAIVSFIILGTIMGMLTPGLKPPLGMPDYLIHSITFFICSLGILSLNLQKYKSTLTILLAFAVILEISQLLVPGRSLEIMDMASNIAGTLAACAVYPKLSMKQV